MRSVLIVDDEELLRQGLIEMFDWEANGYTVAGQAANGAEALALVEADPPDIVLTDVKMPVMDGVELTRHLRERFPGVRTVILSSFNDFDYVRQTLLHGAADYILKPRLNRELLLDALASADSHRGRNLLRGGPDVAFYASCAMAPGPETAFTPALMGFDAAEARDQADRTHFAGAGAYLQGCAAAALSSQKFPTAQAMRQAHRQVYGMLFVHAAWLSAGEQTDPLRRQGLARLDAAPDYPALASTFTALVDRAADLIRDILRQRAGKALGPVWLYLWEHYDQELSLTEVAAKFYMNKSYLCQLFSRHCDTSFGNLLNDIRIYKAKQLLRDADASVQSVARQVGYATPGYFAKQFRRLTGFTPSEYQQQSRRGDGSNKAILNER